MMQFTRYALLYSIVLLSISSLRAEQFSVRDFASSGIAKEDKVKSKRVIDITNDGSGFTFSNQLMGVDASQEDGFSRLVVDKKISYLKIDHPEYGTINWRIPAKRLRKWRLYRAEIALPNDVEHQISRQWLVINSAPKEVIIMIDTAYYRTKDGNLELLLPLGQHYIEATSPLYGTQQDSITLTDESTYRYRVNLTPSYSFLTVNCNVDSVSLYLNTREETQERLTRKRVMSGKHTLYARYRDMEYSKSFEIAASQHRYINIKSDDFRSISRKVVEVDESPYVTDSIATIESLNVLIAERIPLSIKAYDEDCEIFINNEYVAHGSWSGLLNMGDYMLTSRRDGLRSSPIFVELDRQESVEIELNSPASSYGTLNISANVSDAEIYLNGKFIGTTPHIEKYLDTSLDYHILLQRRGCRSAKKKVRLKANSECNIELKLKIKK